jgi:N-acetyltransferase 10
VSQALALFVKIVRKISKRLEDIQKVAIIAEMPTPPTGASGPTGSGNLPSQMPDWEVVESVLNEELDEAGDEATRALREKQRQMIDSLDLSK